MRQELRDRLNRPIGWYDHQGDRIEGRDRLGRLVGWTMRLHALSRM